MRTLFFVLFPLGSIFCQGNIIVKGKWKDADRKEVSLEFLEDATIFKTIL